MKNCSFLLIERTFEDEDGTLLKLVGRKQLVQSIVRPLFYHLDHFHAMKTLELYEKNIQLIGEREIFSSSITS